MSEARKISIEIKTDKAGRRVAMRWCPKALRAIRMPVAEAELMIATGQAVRVESVFKWSKAAR